MNPETVYYIQIALLIVLALALIAWLRHLSWKSRTEAIRRELDSVMYRRYSDDVRDLFAESDWERGRR